jgi:hypothetical protein
MTAAIRRAAAACRQRYRVQLVLGGRVVASTRATALAPDFTLPLDGTKLTAALPAAAAADRGAAVALRLVRARAWPLRGERVATLALRVEGEDDRTPLRPRLWTGRPFVVRRGGRKEVGTWAGGGGARAEAV